MYKNFLIVAVFFGGLVIGWFAQKSDESDTTGMTSTTNNQTALEHAADHQVPGYVCPMHPSVVSNEPASCPICGMDLEAKQLASSSDNANAIAISPAMSNSLGVRIAHTEIGRISEQVFASGNVESVTPATSSDIKSRISGKVKQVFAQTGDWVAEGEFILAIESPEFAELQARYLAAKKISDYPVIKELRKSLAAIDARQSVLDGIDRVNNIALTPEFIVEAPHSGILEWAAEEGDEIGIDQSIALVVTETIARVRLRSYARAARAIKRGRHAQLDLPHMPGLFWPGRVVEINHGDAGFYSLIQADFEVPDGSTEKGVFVGAYVNAGTSEDALRIPASAVIRVEGESRVILLRPDGKFEPRVVETGFIGTQWAEIKSGLEEGDAVVARAHFLIDSEATLRAGFSRLTE